MSDTTDPGRPVLPDDPPLFATVLVAPERVAGEVVFWGDARVLEESDPEWRTVAGWHRRGGPVFLGLTTAPADEGLLVEALQLAGATRGWPVGRWDDAVGRYWDGVETPIVDSTRRRWGFEPDAPRTLAAWCRAAWGEDPKPGTARVGVAAGEVPRRIRRAVEWLREEGLEAAAWEILKSESGFRFVRVAGAWEGATERPLPAEEEAPRRETYLRHTGGATAGILAALERLCRDAGCEVAWSGREWVRFRGPRRSLRAFPSPVAVDLQLVGADEGTLTGYRFRYGVPVGAERPPGAPPGVHLRLSSVEELEGAAGAMAESWLAGAPPGNGGGEGEGGEAGEEAPRRRKRSATPRSPRPRNAREPDPRGRSR